MAENALSVCVVGLGLMGGSLALALREAHWAERLIGVDRDVAMLAVAEERRCDRYRHDGAGGGVAAADVVLLATPVRTILRLLPDVGRHARPGALIMDLGSTKQQICRAMTGLPEGLEPVGGHPMCGKEVAGFACCRGDAVSSTAVRALPRLAHGASRPGARPQPGLGDRRAADRPGSGHPRPRRRRNQPPALRAGGHVDEHRQRRTHAGGLVAGSIAASAIRRAWRAATSI